MVISPALFLSDVVGQLGADGFGIPFRARHDQERIVAGQCSDNIFPFQSVEHLTGRVRHTGVAFDENHMSGIVHAEDGFVKDRLKTALNFRVQRFVVAGNIPVTGARRGFYKAEFPDITGDGGLCGVEPFLPQIVEQRLLTADRIFLDQAQDRLLTLPFAFGIARLLAIRFPLSIKTYRLPRSFWSMA